MIILQHLFMVYQLRMKYRGVSVSKDHSYREIINIENILKKKKERESKIILNTWLQRDLSIFGRILLSKMEALAAQICRLQIVRIMLQWH